jgi:chromosomal replication initiation ATPase DnaA
VQIADSGLIFPWCAIRDRFSLAYAGILLCIGKGVAVPMNDWAKVLQRTKLRVNPHSFATWFRPTRLKGRGHRRLLVRVPTVLFKKKLTETYGELLQAVLQEVGMPDVELEFLPTQPQLPAAPCAVNPAEAHEELKPITHAERKCGAIETIQNRVGEHFGVFPPDLKLRGGSKALVFSRQVAMYLVKQLTSASLSKIGREFGGKHHTTVLTAIKRIEARRCADMQLNQTIGKLVDSLRWQVLPRNSASPASNSESR